MSWPSLGSGMRVGVMSFAHVHASPLVERLLTLGATVVASDPDEQRGRERCAHHGIEYVGTHEELLDQPPDAVVITAENADHPRLTLLAANAGAHVLSEKPLALSMDDANAMVDACRSADVRLMTALPMRFSPQVRRVFQLARSGRLGRIVALAGTNPGTCPGGWFVDPGVSGGGCVIDHTIHVADLMCWLTGAAPTTAYCQTNQLITPDFGVETGGLVAVGFADGAVGTIDTSWSRQDGYASRGGLTLELVGTEGVIALDAFGASLASNTIAGATELGLGADVNLLLVSEFLTAIREGRDPVPSGEDGLRAGAIALAAYRSAQSNAVETIPL